MTQTSIKQNGLGYLYSWQDILWEFGTEEKRKLLPFADSNSDHACAIEPVSRFEAWKLNVPWYYVGNILSMAPEKSKQIKQKMKGRAIFFHTPLDKKHKIANEFKNPFVIWNRIKDNAALELTIIGEYEQTFQLAEEISKGPKECLACLDDLFFSQSPEKKFNEGFVYKNQNTYELYDTTRKPKLRIINQS